MKQEVKEFFDNHPGIDVVHEAIGYLFVDAADAEKFCAGTAEKPITHDRNAITVEKDATGADEEVKEAFEGKEKDKESLPVIHNDATSYGKTAEELEAMKKDQEKKAAEEKEAADKKAKDEKKAADKKAKDEKKAADKKAADEKKAADKKAKDAKQESANKAAANGKPSSK